MNILITGHTGFLGSSLSNFLISKKHTIVGFSRTNSKNVSYTQYSGEITDIENIKQILSDHKIDTIIHCAANAFVSSCETNPMEAYRINMQGSVSVLEAARLTNIRKMLVVESDKIYGNILENPVTETGDLNPTTVYGMSKKLVSSLCDFYIEQYDMNILRIRPVNLFGPGDASNTRLLPNIMKCIYDKREISIYESVRYSPKDFLYIKDAVEMTYTLLINNPKERIYNLSSNNPFTLNDFVNMISEILDHKIPHKIIKDPIVFNLPKQTISSKRFIEEFGFSFTPYEIAIRETFLDYVERMK